MNYYLDPDFRPKIPSNKDGTVKPHCCRCRKEFKNNNYKHVVVDWDNWKISDETEMPHNFSNPSAELIGLYCWKKIIKDKS